MYPWRSWNEPSRSEYGRFGRWENRLNKSGNKILKRYKTLGNDFLQYAGAVTMPFGFNANAMEHRQPSIAKRSIFRGDNVVAKL